MNDELDISITLILGPFTFKFNSSSRPSYGDSPSSPTPPLTSTGPPRRTQPTAATIASKSLSRLSHHLRSFSSSGSNTKKYTLRSSSSSFFARTMSSTTVSAPTEAPWKKSFQEHISKMDSPKFVFSSLAPAKSKDSPVPYLPRARFCIMRSFWAELPENKHNNAEKNERVFESDLPAFTTDQRMSKTFELFNSSPGHADRESLIQGSGGGGPCEAVFWVKEVGVQWRIKGETYIIANDIESDEESSGVRTVKSELGKRMRCVKEEGRDGWSWKREVRGHFGNMSPGMRGTFSNPPPGQPVDQPYDDKKYHLPGEKVEDLDDEAARENFRVAVIVPEEVESVDLSDPAKSRRQVYKFDQKSGTWSHQECWP